MSASKPGALLLGVAFVATLVIQLPELGRPPFDYHNFRQSQTLSTIELFAKDGIDLLHPRANYQGEPGIFVLEFPIFQAAGAVLYRIAGPRIELIRAFNLLITFVSCAAVFAIVRRRFTPVAAAAASALFICSPLNLAYMSSVLIDPTAVCSALWSFYFCDRLLSETKASRRTWLLFTLCSLLTALVKALYLFPVCVLIVFNILRTRKISAAFMQVCASMALAGAIFLTWNRYATHINNASFFTGGINPTALLGLSELFNFSFVRRIGQRIFIEILGPLGGFFLLGGLLSLAFERRKVGSGRVFFLLVCGSAVFGYWAAFAHITYYHDYYSLIVVGFCAIAAAIACEALGDTFATRLQRPAQSAIVTCTCAVLVVAASLTFFVSERGFVQDANASQFAELSSGQLVPFSYAMIFIGAGKSPGGAPIHEAPAMLWAGHVRGTSLVVANEAQALEQWNRFHPHYSNLRYVVFFGLQPPKEIVDAIGSPKVRREREQFAMFDLAAKP